MSRLHKYRAWDGMNKKFSYWTMNDLCAWGEDKEKPSTFDDWQEYTGLKDKNGKEIYEGDIIKVWDMNRGCDCEDEVDGKEPVENEHRPDCECYVTTQKIEWSQYGGYFCDEDTGDGCMSLGSDEFEFEVIGNLYESPELLAAGSNTGGV